VEEDLFGPVPVPQAAAQPAPAPARPAPRKRAQVVAAEPAAAVAQLAAALPAQLHLGTSSWSFPGWKGLVWASEHGEQALAREGLAAYASHPLLRGVSLDRAFYKPLSASEYARYAAQVPAHFRFVVKAPSLVADAMVRGEEGQGLQENPAFLDPALALSEFVEPAIEGLGAHIGALVFQLSPLPPRLLADLPAVLERLAALLAAIPPLPAGAVVAVEVRNPEFLTPAFAAVLKQAGATYCLGLHARMPPVEEQLPLLRALWPGPLVCRWNLHRRHGAYGYETAKAQYEPFDKLVDPDPQTREVLAKVAAATLSAGWPTYITINNKAEGSAPLSVEALAAAIGEKLSRP
jgi:uncharacterized protein YecE (DUF72 family)